ncbi:MBOAT family O-acyltransferase [Candidatus Uabimicrobium amorphum]|uniref:Membrane-bound O-acyltransferase family protein n=1 Tax=Uabimicrobium amorphum TaxID=2596890 RepID=A0A5S9ISG2_UABAM|nr:MBOAT family O-acyltransferase [Candidatus Uabimicrobium amorphum]BBM87313.1 membrane-bound O-acyltransferase family protein [Candidatus Uabimicrobium amorphum]
MLFNSIAFLFFAFIFTTIYFYLRGQYRLLWILLCSYVFYGWWDYRFLILIAFSTAVDFFIAQYLHRESTVRKRRLLLVVSVCTNLAVLGFFKYCNFFIDSFSLILIHVFGENTHLQTLDIILPVGISFYTFQSMSYTIDVYRNKILPEKNAIMFASYIAFFPQLVAGPIVRARQLLPQFHQDQKFNWNQFTLGFAQVLVGYFKKIVVADSLVIVIDQVFTAPNNFNALNITLGVVLYSFQIYCDFSGYSDIAIGFARMLGFEFPVNFRMPYFSRNFSEFWTRWHISLSSWLRDYVYIPLGGNRNGRINTYKNLLITMLLGGLWHGANWKFVFWGFLHGLYLILQRMASPLYQRVNRYLPHIVQIALAMTTTYILTCAAWIFFRSESFTKALEIFHLIFTGDWSLHNLKNKFPLVKSIFVILLLLTCEIAHCKWNFTNVILHHPRLRIFIFATILWTIALLGTFNETAFIYFQF